MVIGNTASGTFYVFNKKEQSTPIVFIHGVGLTYEIWQPQLDFFKNYSNLSYDILGHGKSSLTKQNINFDDFAKMDIRIGEIVAAEKMEKSKKLLKLQVNDGFITRTILSGIAEHFAPEDLVGKQVTFLANLAPRKMMGIESEGMILMAEDADGSLALVQPNKQIWNGGTVN